MADQRTIPSRFRCLKFSPIGLLAWVMVMGLQLIKMGVCHSPYLEGDLPGVCTRLPPQVYYVLLAMLAYAIVRVGWVAYRDHVCGDYQADLAAGRDRYRGRWI